MTSRKLLPVILSGGVGSRLWPLSRERHPKPFIKLPDGDSFLQKTYKRASKLSFLDEVVVVTNTNLFFYSKDECEEVCTNGMTSTFISEPVGRNSTAAIGLAANYAQKKFGADCILLVLPADHLIEDDEQFKIAVNKAIELATSGSFVTFGIKPSRAETGYGYILANGNAVKSFVEKPNAKQAADYISDGRYFWNSGMFCVTADTYLSELDRYAPDIALNTRIAFVSSKVSTGIKWSNLEVPKASFENIRSESVDYAILEKSKNVAVVPCDIGWSDVGSWIEMGAIHSKDESGNSIHGSVVCHQTTNSFVYGSGRLIATLGVDDLIIADTDDALLVAHTNYAQNIKNVVDDLKTKQHPSVVEFQTVHRPWGSYTVLQEGVGFKVKRIDVKPNGQLSLQSHRHRSEHWVVVEGAATVTNGDKVLELTRNQSTYIPIGNQHRLQNLQMEHLVLIEVQCGSYLGEDDITRYSDEYGRTAK